MRTFDFIKKKKITSFLSGRTFRYYYYFLNHRKIVNDKMYKIITVMISVIMILLMIMLYNNHNQHMHIYNIYSLDMSIQTDSYK